MGWVTGHTYIAYGPLAVGATEIVFEGVPTYPDAGRFWKMIQDHKVNVFYTAPTAIRSLIKAGGDLPKKYDLSSLRILGTVGEPINPEAWMWYYTTVGGSRCPIVDTFWQTETGGHMITPLPGVTPLKPGSCTLPLPGIMAAIVDETGHDLPNGQGGILVVKRPWPSMIRTIWGDPERFRKSYYPEELGGKLYLAGDGSIRDKDTGYFTIMGRIDDVLNVSGHRMGTMEIESALVANTRLVAEAAVVGRPDDLTGEAVVAFVVLKGPRPTGDEARELAKELRDWVAKEIGPIAKPKEIRFGDNLPKTRSGKIMRRLLRVARQGRGDHAGRLDAREPGDPGAAQAPAVARPAGRRPGRDGACAPSRLRLTGVIPARAGRERLAPHERTPAPAAAHGRHRRRAAQARPLRRDARRRPRAPRGRPQAALLRARTAVILSPDSGRISSLFIIQRGAVQADEPSMVSLHTMAATLTDGECFPVGALIAKRPTTPALQGAEGHVLLRARRGALRRGDGAQPRVPRLLHAPPGGPARRLHPGHARGLLEPRRRRAHHGLAPAQRAPPRAGHAAGDRPACGRCWSS